MKSPRSVVFRTHKRLEGCLDTLRCRENVAAFQRNPTGVKQLRKEVLDDPWMRAALFAARQSRSRTAAG